MFNSCRHASFTCGADLQPPAGWHNLLGRVALVDREDQTKVVANLKTLPPDHLFDFARIPSGSYLAYGELDGTPRYRAAKAVNVSGQDVEDLFLSLARADAIAGVLKSKSDDRQVDFQKISVKIAEFQIGMVGTGSGSPPVKIADDLTFRVPLGWSANFAGFRLMVSDLPEGCYVASIRYGGTDVPEPGIEYSPGATLVITIGADGGRVDGKTVGEDGQPFGGVVVGLFSAAGQSGPRSLQADAQGAFHFSGIPPGDYQLIAWDDVSRDGLENPEFVKRFDSQATAITLSARFGDRLDKACLEINLLAGKLSFPTASAEKNTGKNACATQECRCYLGYGVFQPLASHHRMRFRVSEGTSSRSLKFIASD
jgi:hypothetical protein